MTEILDRNFATGENDENLLDNHAGLDVGLTQTISLGEVVTPVPYTLPQQVRLGGKVIGLGNFD